MPIAQLNCQNVAGGEKCRLGPPCKFSHDPKGCTDLRNWMQQRGRLPQNAPAILPEYLDGSEYRLQLAHHAANPDPAPATTPLAPAPASTM